MALPCCEPLKGISPMLWIELFVTFDVRSR